ncbi:hypothetical protein [Novosphingobium terrae]|uniref:hypothetical protein n=1 Tax=Novosphingobium terrae TaxID=2726189 RepID=UPI001981D678|nr:hypothetical protein [Novosphingobium terrae]
MKPFVVLAFSLALCSCTTNKADVSGFVKRITVSGSPQKVEHFARHQRFFNGAVLVSNITIRPNGEAEATMSFRGNYAPDDLIHTTQEAVAAGLSYTYTDLRLTTSLS